MAALKIAELGNPILRKIAAPLDVNQLAGSRNGEIQSFIDDLIDTMRLGSGVGIAAPQVSRSIRIVVAEYAGNERYPGKDDIPLMVLVNPVIVRYSEEKAEGWESCLSLTNLKGLALRSTGVTVEAYGRDGKKVVIEAEDFLAVVLQHEIDHLEGILFLDRMPDLTKLCFEEEYARFWLNEAPVPQGEFIGREG